MCAGEALREFRGGGADLETILLGYNYALRPCLYASRIFSIKTK